MAIQKTIDEIWKYIIVHHVHNTFNIQNESFTIFIYNLPIKSSILVYWDNIADQSGE